MSNAPVLILGLHRSGTTLLYQLLEATGYFNILTARHVGFFDDLVRPHRDRAAFERRVVERFALLGRADRRIDSVSVGPDTPEEYGFLLERLSGSYAFSRSSAGALRLICDTINRDAGTRRTVLLKNPWDFDRADLIGRVIPGARFVFIHRNPFDILSSTLRMVLAVFERPNAYLALLSERYNAFSQGGFPWSVAQKLGGAAPGRLADWIIRWVAARVSGFVRSQVPCARRVHPHIRYESLCGDANAVIGGVLDRLGFAPTERDFSKLIALSNSRIHKLILERRKCIVRLFGDYASDFGYDLDRIAHEMANASPEHP